MDRSFLLFLHPSDDLPGQDHRQQGIADSPGGDIAQGEEKNRQVADQVDSFDGDPGEVGKTHCQSIVTTGGTAGTDTQTGADADEQSTGNGCGNGIVCNLRIDMRELLTYTISQRKAACSDQGINNKISAQCFPAQQIAGGIQ